MTDYIATFHTHFAAMRSEKQLRAHGVSARLAPVPRKLSASCGTCVKYQSDSPMLELLDRDVERVVRCAGDGYEELFMNE